MAGFTGTKTQEDIKKNEENKQKKIGEKKNTVSDKDKEMFSLSYDEAKSKYGQGVGNNKYFMSKSDFDKRQKELGFGAKEEPKKEQSLVANQFGDKKGWNDVLIENGSDPEKIKDWLNNNPGYKAGERTKKGMSEFGYKQGEDGKWVKDDSVTKTTETTATDTTTDDVLTGVEGITKEDPKAEGFVNGVTNEDGSVNEQKAYNAMSQYEQKLVEIGAGSFDKDGKFVFKDTTKKGWEDWATMLSVGASVIGLAMGVPIMPINFRKITNKDEKDAKIREFQKQYTDIMAGNAAKVKDVESSAEAGKLVKTNEDAINAFSEYAENVPAYKAKSTIDTDSEKELIETRTDAQIKADEARFNNEMKRIKAEQDFTLKLEALREKYKEQFAALESALMTGSAKELMKYQNGEMFKEMEEMGMTPRKLATWNSAKNGISPADKVFNKINTGVNTVINLMKPGDGD